MNLGIVEAQGAGNPGNAVDYVLANPVGQAVLRPLRYPSSGGATL